MEELILRFSKRDPKSRVVKSVMAPDNESEPLQMRTSLKDLASISIEQGIEIARSMWFAFNSEKNVIDIAPCITDATVCTRYPANKKSKSEGTFSIEARLPFEYVLDGLKSNLISVEFMAPDGLHYHVKQSGPKSMTATINTAKPVAEDGPKKSWLGKTFEMILGALTATRAAPSDAKDLETSAASIPAPTTPEPEAQDEA
jgi:hypothetical protein